MNRSLSEVDPQIVEIMLQDLDRLQNCSNIDPFRKLCKSGGHADAGKCFDQ